MFLWQQASITSGAPVDPMKFPLFGTVATDYTNPQFIVSDTYHYTTGYAWKMFDANQTSYWYTYQQHATATATIECVTPKVLRSLRIHNDLLAEQARIYRPGSIKIEVRNNTTDSWVTLATPTLTWTTINTFREYTASVPISNNIAYKYYRLSYTRAAGATYVAVTTLMLSEGSQIDFLVPPT